MYDYLLSDEGYRLSHFGVEGVTYRLEEDGGITLLTGETPSGRYPSIGMLASLVAWNHGIQEDVGDSPSVPAEYQREDEKRVERARGCPIPDVFSPENRFTSCSFCPENVILEVASTSVKY